MDTETKVANHYTREGLEARILQAVTAAGKDIGRLTIQDLAPVDEFHVGGLEATQQLAGQMELRPGLRLLDVGCGIGGPARYFASEHGCNVSGIDLTQEFVQVANSLTRLLKLEHLAQFRCASALELPFEPETFDGAYMIHTGMNIADKAGVFREARRVLRSGGLFTIYEIMRAGEGAMRYPVPWAMTEETSFVADLRTYRETLEGTGFEVEKERGRRAFGIEFAERVTARMAQSGAPALGLQLLMDDQASAMRGNLLALMKEGTIEPVEVCARATL